MGIIKIIYFLLICLINKFFDFFSQLYDHIPTIQFFHYFFSFIHLFSIYTHNNKFTLLTVNDGNNKIFLVQR